MDGYLKLHRNNKTLVFIPDTFTIISIKDEAEVDNILSTIDGKIKKSEILKYPEIKTIELDFCLTKRCNLNCQYCYANQKIEQNQKDMTFDIAKRAVDFFDEKFPNTEWKVDFIGQGEPLLCFDLLVKLVEYINIKRQNEKNRFFLITNGTMLKKEIYERLSDMGVSIGVSIDGDEKEHNMNRLFGDGKGSYQIIKQNLSELNFRKNNVWSLSVIDGKNHLHKIIEANKKLGFNRIQTKIARISGEANKNRADVRDALSKQYDIFFHKLYNELLLGNMSTFYAIINETDHIGKVLRALLTCQKNFRRCKAGFARYSISTDGEIFPCSSFNSIMECKIGNIIGGDFNQKIVEKFAANSVDENKICQKCWCRYLCGGFCRYSSFCEFTGLDTPNLVDCDVMKMLCEKCVIILIDLKVNNPRILKRMIRFSEINESI